MVAIRCLENVSQGLWPVQNGGLPARPMLNESKVYTRSGSQSVVFSKVNLYLWAGKGLHVPGPARDL